MNDQELGFEVEDFIKNTAHQAKQMGDAINVGCALIEIAQSADLEVQLGEGTFELVAAEFEERVRSFTRGDDQVINVSANCKLVLLTNLSNQDHLALAAAKLERLMAPPVNVVNHSVLIKTNAGFAMARAGMMPGVELLDAARKAMESGTAEQRYVIHDPQTAEQDASRWQLKTDLEKALHQGEFFPYFEPVLAATYGSVSAGAAQMVWHSERGPVPHRKFASAIEEAGLARPVAWQFLKTTLGQASHWDASIGAVVPMPSAAFTDDEILQEISDAMAIYDIAPGRLTVEAPEDALQLPVGRQVLASIRKQKVAVRVHGIGKRGFPFEVLGDLPADQVTFDASVIGKQTPPKMKQLIFEMFKQTNTNLVALNVKDVKLARKYRDLGFSELQGPAVGPLMRADAFTKWLKTKVGAVG